MILSTINKKLEKKTAELRDLCKLHGASLTVVVSTVNLDGDNGVTRAVTTGKTIDAAIAFAMVLTSEPTLRCVLEAALATVEKHGDVLNSLIDIDRR